MKPAHPSRNSWPVAFLLLGILASGCAWQGLSSWAAGVPPAQLRPEQIIVALPLVAPTAIADATRNLARQYGLKPSMRGFPLPSIGLHCIVLDVPADTDVDDTLARIAMHPGVRLAQRNQRFETFSTRHSDPYASLQHGPAAMRVDQAHRVATGRGIRIGLVDTGVDRDHADLAQRIAASRNFVRGGARAFSRDAHGTAVAGVIVANADDGIGIYGVAPNAELVAAKACWHGDGSSEGALCSSWTLALAIDYAIENEAQVLNLSLGGPPDALLETLLAKAAEESIVIVAAAGDGSDEPRFPASLEFVIGVVEASDVLSPASVPARTLAAPGQEIITTAPGDAYRYHSGSSLSTAHVSGLVALLLEHAPELSPREIGEVLARSAGGAAAGSSPAVADACTALRAIRSTRGCESPSAR